LGLFGANDDSAGAHFAPASSAARELASIGFAFPRNPRFSSRNAVNWLCFARMMTPRRAVPAGRLSICDWVLGKAQVGLNWVRWGTFSCDTRRPDQILAALYAMLNCGLYSVFIIHACPLGVKPNPRNFPRRGRPPCLPAPSADDARGDPQQRRPRPKTPLTGAGVSYTLTVRCSRGSYVRRGSDNPGRRRRMKGEMSMTSPHFASSHSK